MITRRFEMIAGGSFKFWEVTVTGCSVSVRYGRIGTNGQSQTTSFHTEDEAQRHAEKLISSKIAKGYAELVAQ